MMTIHTLSDLRTWAQNLGGLDAGDLQTLVDSIHDDDRRPSWGVDWEPYLDGVDIFSTVIAREVRYVDELQQFAGEVQR